MNNYDNNIILYPKNIGLQNITDKLSGIDSIQETTAIATIHSVKVDTTKLTSCCIFKNFIICAGFAGDIIFLDKKNYYKIFRVHVSDQIIRCLNVIEEFSILLIGTDDAEVIAYDLNLYSKIQTSHSASSIFNIILKNSNSFITSERNGDIFIWNYNPKDKIHRINKLFNAESTVFAINFINNTLYVANSFGKRFKYNITTSNVWGSYICNVNIFCIKEGINSCAYYGLANGMILSEHADGRLETFESHQDAVRDLVLSPQKKWLFSVSKDKTIRAWHNGIPILLSKVKDYLYQIVFNQQDASLFYVDGNGELGIVKFNIDIDTAESISISN